MLSTFTIYFIITIAIVLFLLCLTMLTAIIYYLYRIIRYNPNNIITDNLYHI